MKNTARIFLATYFTALSILYLTGRYTTFEMHPSIFAVASIVLLLFIWSVMRYGQEQGVIEWTMLVLTVLMLAAVLAG
ncbi:hypothetical protein [Salinicoccus luteus]|uniref:hypothetical protein n=1 Tax=Salinicoccus luteus TaxID=367840 RepID=UPI0012EB259F|nr:hypothetical protein [Salinicoccus luteus]